MRKSFYLHNNLSVIQWTSKSLLILQNFSDCRKFNDCFSHLNTWIVSCHISVWCICFPLFSEIRHCNYCTNKNNVTWLKISRQYGSLSNLDILPQALEWFKASCTNLTSVSSNRCVKLQKEQRRFMDFMSINTDCREKCIFYFLNNHSAVHWSLKLLLIIFVLPNSVN